MCFARLWLLAHHPSHPASLNLMRAWILGLRMMPRPLLDGRWVLVRNAVPTKSVCLIFLSLLILIFLAVGLRIAAILGQWLVAWLQQVILASRHSPQKSSCKCIGSFLQTVTTKHHLGLCLSQPWLRPAWIFGCWKYIENALSFASLVWELGKTSRVWVTSMIAKEHIENEIYISN